MTIVCTRCATTAWHPEVRQCPFGDCPLRAELAQAARDPRVITGNDSEPVHAPEVSHAAR